MPLFREWSPDDHSLAAIWQIGEDEAFFLDRVRNAARTGQIRHPRRRAEHLAGRYLLRYLKDDFPLHHIAADVHDKPRLPGDTYFFSISHSFPYVAAVISDTAECGIDIQVWHDRIGKIAHKFLSEEEQEICMHNDRLQTLAWCAKEAAYKWNGRRGADFIRDLPISRILGEAAGAGEHIKPDLFSVDMRCFEIGVRAEAALYSDFALGCIARHHPRADK